MTVLALLVLSAVQQGSVQQKTHGWCSPPIANVQGNVTVNCVGVDPRALDHLNVLLSHKKEELREKIREANEWAEKYFELEKRLSEATADTQLSAKAEKYLHEGNLAEAEAILDGLLQHEEQNIDRAAANHYNMALILDLQFQPRESLAHLEKAYRYRPESVEYAHQYARALDGANRLDEAEGVYRLNLAHFRELAKVNQNGFLPLAAKTCRNLGFLYIRMGKTKEAEASYEEALGMYRLLADTDPSTYLLLQAASLDGLADVYDKLGIFDKAQRYYGESLDTYKRVATQFGNIYNVDAAMLLDHLGEHYSRTKNPKDAETMYKEVLAIARRMAEGNQPGYGWILALALGHLGELYHQLHRSAEAENAYQESLSIFRQMPNTVTVYLMLQASTLNNLGSLYTDTNRVADAAKVYAEAMEIFRRIAKDDPANSSTGVAMELHNLGIAYVSLGKFSEAEKADQESIAAFRQLAAKEQATYLPSVAGTLSNLGDAYRKDGKLSLAISCYQEALEVYRRLADGNPAVHRHDVAMILNVLGVLYGEDQKFGDAVDYYEKSLNAYRDLSKAGYGSYLREEAWVFGNLAGLGVDRHLPLEQAQAYNEEALKIQRELWNADPSLYGDELAVSLMVKAQLVGIPGPHHGEACALVIEAQRIASSDLAKQGSEILANQCK